MEPYSKSCVVLFETSQGNFTLKARKKWAPIGYNRFVELVKTCFFDDTRLFRVIKSYVVHFGISGNPDISKTWKEKKALKDEQPLVSNLRGTMAYAMDTTPDSRTTQVYINYMDNTKLDGRFTPFAEVVEGMEVVDKFYHEYGRAFDDQTLQDTIEEKGNTFLDAHYPKLDRIIKARLISAAPKSPFTIVNSVLEPGGIGGFAKWCKSLKSIQTSANVQLLYQIKLTIEFKDMHRAHRTGIQPSLKQGHECALMSALFSTLLNRFGKELKLVGNHSICFSVKRLHIANGVTYSDHWNCNKGAMMAVIQNDFVEEKDIATTNNPENMDPKNLKLEFPKVGSIVINKKKDAIQQTFNLKSFVDNGTRTLAYVSLEEANINQ